MWAARYTRFIRQAVRAGVFATRLRGKQDCLPACLRAHYIRLHKRNRLDLSHSHSDLKKKKKKEEETNRFIMQACGPSNNDSENASARRESGRALKTRRKERERERDCIWRGIWFFFVFFFHHVFVITRTVNNNNNNKKDLFIFFFEHFPKDKTHRRKKRTPRGKKRPGVPNAGVKAGLCTTHPVML